MIIKTIQLWKGRKDVTLTVYLLEKNEEILGSAKRPAVIISPGGGYQGFTEREGEAAALRFTAMGYQSFVLHYSIGEKAAFPNAVYDIAQAFCYIHQHAQELYVEEQKIAVCGFSAGANVSASLGVLWDKNFLSEKLEVPSEWLRPEAMILAYPLINPEIQDCGNLKKNEREMIMQCNAFLAGCAHPTKEDYKKLNLLNYVSEKTPPAFLFHLHADPIVPVDNTLHFAGRLAEYCVPFEVFIAEDTWHGVSLFNSKYTGQGFFQDSYADWFNRATEWLREKMF